MWIFIKDHLNSLFRKNMFGIASLKNVFFFIKMLSFATLLLSNMEHKYRNTSSILIFSQKYINIFIF